MSSRDFHHYSTSWSIGCDLFTLFEAVFDHIRENARGMLNSECACVKFVFPQMLRFSGFVFQEEMACQNILH
jgi:hypothetical protein